MYLDSIRYSTILALFLLPELASAQGSVSASASVRAHVRESCPQGTKRCRPKPPKPPKEDDENDDDDDADLKERRIAGSHSRALQSFLQSAEVVTADGEVVFPSHVTLGHPLATAGSGMSPISRWWISLDPGLADPNDRSAVWWEWWGTGDEHGLTIVAEY